MAAGHAEQVETEDKLRWNGTSLLAALVFNANSSRRKVTVDQMNPHKTSTGAVRVTSGIPLTRANIGGIIDALAAGRRNSRR